VLVGRTRYTACLEVLRALGYVSPPPTRKCIAVDPGGELWSTGSKHGISSSTAVTSTPSTGVSFRHSTFRDISDGANAVALCAESLHAAPREPLRRGGMAAFHAAPDRRDPPAVR